MFTAQGLFQFCLHNDRKCYQPRCFQSIESIHLTCYARRSKSNTIHKFSNFHICIKRGGKHETEYAQSNFSAPDSLKHCNLLIDCHVNEL